MADTDAAAPDRPPTVPAGARRKRHRTVPLVVTVLALGVVAVYIVQGRRAGAAASGDTTAMTTTTAPMPGELVEIPALSLNLADGRFLRVGLALRLVKGENAEEWTKSETPLIRDLLISFFAGRRMSDLASSDGREGARRDLLAQARERHGDAVLAVYFTEFVMQ